MTRSPEVTSKLGKKNHWKEGFIVCLLFLIAKSFYKQCLFIPSAAERTENASSLAVNAGKGYRSCCPWVHVPSFLRVWLTLILASPGTSHHFLCSGICHHCRFQGVQLMDFGFLFPTLPWEGMGMFHRTSPCLLPLFWGDKGKGVGITFSPRQHSWWWLSGWIFIPSLLSSHLGH